MIRAILYDATGHDRETDPSKVDVARLGADQLLWIDGPAKELQAADHLPPPVSLSGLTETANGLEIFEECYRVSVPLPTKTGASEKSWLGFIVGKTWLVTIADTRPPFLDEFVEADRGETLKGRLTPSGLAAALLSRHLDGYREEMTTVDSAIDTLDDTILRSKEQRSPLKTLAVLRRRVATIRSALDAHRVVIHALNSPDFFAHIDEADRPHFEHLNRAFDRLEDDVVRARETVVGSFELYTSRVTQDTNQLVKALTIATVVTGIIGAVAGIFGMNFDTSIPHSGMTGFALVTGGMVLSGIAIVAIAIWRNWL